MLGIPENIKKEIFLIERGKKLKKRVKQEPSYSQKELLSIATRNLAFLNEVANTEPVLSFLRGSGSKRTILIIDHFNTTYPQRNPQDNIGCLVLTVIGGVASFYNWVDADYPVNRSDGDYTLVTEKELERWHNDSLKQFALLTEKDIWKNILRCLNIMRS